jgi:hypothetical protein
LSDIKDKRNTERAGIEVKWINIGEALTNLQEELANPQNSGREVRHSD